MATQINKIMTTCGFEFKLLSDFTAVSSFVFSSKNILRPRGIYWRSEITSDIKVFSDTIGRHLSFKLKLDTCSTVCV